MPGSWKMGLNYREMADELIAELAETGFTHVEFLPLAGHPFAPSWGYQVTSYYAPDSRFGGPDDLRYLIDRLHQAGIGVILDWVPAHFPKDEWALGKFDGTSLYEHADPRRGEQPDWGTFVFDFGRREVRNFLVANALYWLEQYHIDGLRVDAVASMLYLDYSREDGQWLPNIYGGNENLDAVAFLQETNATVGKRVPGVLMIAEESTAWPGVTRPTHLGGLGFHLKWNMGWMHDSLGYISRDAIYRSWHHNEMTFSLMYAFSEQFVLPISHDEVVHGKGSLWSKIPGDEWQKAATLRTFLAHQWAHPGKQLLFMGQELGNPWEWNQAIQMPWQLKDYPLHNGVRTLVGDLNRVYKSSPALYSQDFTPAGFTWLDANDREGNVLAYLRWGADGSVIACVLNFAPMPHSGYRIGLPFAGVWREAVNTDSELYGGSGAGNMGAVVAVRPPVARPTGLRDHHHPAARRAVVGAGIRGVGPMLNAHRARRRSGRVGVSRVSGLLVVALAGCSCWSAWLVLLVVTVSPAALVGGSAAPRWPRSGSICTTPAVPIAVAGSFGDAAALAEPDPLANSADGDRAVAAVLADLQDFWADAAVRGRRPGLRAPAGGYVSMDSDRRHVRARRLCITDPAQIAGNAFYCPQGDGIVFDSSALVPVLLGSYGSAGLAAAFAHEFGHAVQAQVGPTAERPGAGPGPLPVDPDRGAGRLRRRRLPGLGVLR